MTKKRGIARRKDDLQYRFGAVVRDCRRRLGISQDELGWRAGLHRTYITDIERGVRNISLRSVSSLSKGLDVSMWSLFASAAGLAEGNPGAGGRESGPAFGEILMVEDNPVDVELALRAFKRARFVNPVRVARDGEEALDYIYGGGRLSRKRGKPLPQLILLDLYMPKVSGIEFLRRLKSNERTRSVPVIVLTSSRHDKNILECSRLGVENYIIKPVAFDALSKVTAQLSLGWALWPQPSGD
ncbi:MAG: response regulator [Opitutaceae bacterium]